MSCPLYRKVYDYLECFTVHTQGFREYTYYMDCLGNVIKCNVNDMIRMQGCISDISKLFWEIAEEANKPLKILIMGEFKTGKSTFINTLLGQNILKSDVLPATAVATYICHGKTQSVIVELQDGTRWTYPISVLEELTAEGNSYYADLRRKIKAVHVQLPLEFLRYVTLIDSPGLNVDISYHVEATQTVLENADFVIWVINMSHPGTKEEIHAIKKLPPYLRPVVVFNGIDLIDPEEEDVGRALETAFQRVQNISLRSFGVSARETQLAIKANDTDAYEEFGWNGFLTYFKSTICQNWFVWKAKAMAGKIKKYGDCEISNHYDAYINEWREQKQIIRESSQHHWPAIESLRARREELQLSIMNSVIASTGVLDQASGTVIQSEINRISSIMQGIGLIFQETGIVNPFSREQYMQLQYICQCYQQLWNYLQSQVQLFNLGGDQQAVKNIHVTVNQFINYNKMYLASYDAFSNIQNHAEDQYYEKYKDQIEQLKAATINSKILEQRLGGWELYMKIAKQISLEV